MKRISERQSPKLAQVIIEDVIETIITKKNGGFKINFRLSPPRNNAIGTQLKATIISETSCNITLDCRLKFETLVKCLSKGFKVFPLL